MKLLRRFWVLSSDVNALIEEIKRRAEEEIKKILEEAKKEADKIVEEAKEEAKRKFQHEAHSRLLLLRRRILGKAEMKGRHELLKAKEEILEKIKEIATERLKRIVEGSDPRVNYHDILYRLIEEAAKGIDEPEIIIEANERDKEYLSVNIRRLEEQLSKSIGKPIKIRISDSVANILGGVIVYNRDRTKIYYNTLEGRLSETIEKYRAILGSKLFREFLA